MQETHKTLGRKSRGGFDDEQMATTPKDMCSLCKVCQQVRSCTIERKAIDEDICRFILQWWVFHLTLQLPGKLMAVQTDDTTRQVREGVEAAPHIHDGKIRAEEECKFTA